MSVQPSVLLSVLTYLFLLKTTSYIDLIHDNLDHHDLCPTWSEEGRCDEETNIMELCPKSCLIQTLLKRILAEAVQGMEYHRMPTEQDCFDSDNDSCQRLAEQGNCLLSDPVRVSCRKSCRVCISEEKFKFGVKQEILPYDPLALAALINVRDTANYMRDVIMVEETPARRDCFNHYEDCSFRAGAGHCHDPRYLVEMELNCAPACHACHRLALRRRCPISKRDGNVIESVQLNKVFEKFQDHETKSNINARLLSKPRDNNKPWIVYIDSFLTAQECDVLIEVGRSIGFKQSIVDNGEEIDTSENEERGEAASWRTSETAWCDLICQKANPVVDGFMDRISRLIGLPRKNMEPLQLLRYKPGQLYTKHHDYIESQRYLPCGPRVLTFFLYLNTNNGGGGETFFSDLGISISPTRGAAVVWPNVLDHSLKDIDIRTFHEAKPVKKGVKFAANIWFHPFDYDAALQNGCT